jgi:hypothetical protein
MPNTLQYEEYTRYAHLTGAATAINRSGSAKLHRVTVNDAGTATLTIYDNNAASGTVVAVVDCSVAGTFEYGFNLTTGLTVVLSATADVTVVYQ